MSVAATTGAVAGAAALAAYLDARFHIRNDLALGARPVSQLRIMLDLYLKVRRGKLLTYSVFEDRAGTRAGESVFLVFEGRQWTYSEFFRALQPVGNWLLKDLGVRRGDVVALDGGNSPEYLLLWLALEAVGAAPAFLNCNLTGRPLVHSIQLSGARLVLADDDVRPLVGPVEEELAGAGAKTVYYGPELFRTLTDTEPLPADRRADPDPMGLHSLMYTSGTTGLPKGVVITHGREAMIRTMAGKYLNLKPNRDRIYTCLPLYHASAHGLCVLACISAGATVVLSRRFSHKTFWPEVVASGATTIQYVGELCRYLVNAPAGPLDRAHRVERAWGNGMRPDVWARFRDRFGITCIHELYGASDGAGMMANANRGPFTENAIALRGPLWHLLNGGWERRVRVDPDSGEVVRGADGLAVEARVGEPGEAVFRLDARDPDRGGVPAYFGNRAATVSRRLADVFRRGDLWFRSGDLMRLDAEGRLFFVDRLGDTFRWRSENVSTSEVADVVGARADVAEANVYGVLVPNADGRAGCAAVVPTAAAVAAGGLDFEALATHCLASLPRYAVPLFIRVVREIEYTGTMKMQKGRLRAEGIELAAIARAAADKGEPAVDAMYWLPPGGAKAYVPFTEADLASLKAGRARL
ncbi:fatty-acyl-CoA synthase [Xylariaceae sp. FL0804]|nr:fatty-acyl-CoA synthase [Xylariaceae sp. FL0804]